MLSPAIPIQETAYQIPFRILVIVEAHMAIHQLAKILMEQQAFDCVGQLADPGEALWAADGLRPHLAIVYFPSCADASLGPCREIKDHYPKTKLLVIDDASCRSARNCRESGAWHIPDRVIGKDLVEYVHRLLLSEPMASEFPNRVAGSASRPVNSEQQTDSPSGPHFTEAERAVLRLLVQGQANANIAKALSLSTVTVKWHLQRIYANLGARSRTEAVALLLRRGMEVDL